MAGSRQEPIVPGYRFNRGKEQLVIVDESRVRLVRGWPQLDAVQKIHGMARWQDLQPNFQLIRPIEKIPKPKPRVALPKPPQLEFGFGLDESQDSGPGLAEQQRQAFDAFRRTFPTDVAAAVERFRTNQWPLLHALRQRPELLDIARTNPALFYLFACKHWHAAMHGQLPTLKGVNQAMLAGHLGFPASKGTVRLLGKVAAESVCAGEWADVRQLFLREEGAALKHLRHLPAINLGVLWILLDTRLEGWITATLLEEVAALNEEKYRARTAERLEDVATMWDVVHPGRPPRQIQSLERLDAQHDEVSCEYLAIDAESNDPAYHPTFPDPPLRGIPGRIEPIRSADELREEGRTQDNCVASYAGRVVERRTFIYRVLGPQRSTLSIVPDPSGGWQIGELEVSGNRGAAPTTVRSVEQWLASRVLL